MGSKYVIFNMNETDIVKDDDSNSGSGGPATDDIFSGGGGSGSGGGPATDDNFSGGGGSGGDDGYGYGYAADTELYSTYERMFMNSSESESSMKQSLIMASNDLLEKFLLDILQLIGMNNQYESTNNDLRRRALSSYLESPSLQSQSTVISHKNILQRKYNNMFEEESLTTMKSVYSGTLPSGQYGADIFCLPINTCFKFSINTKKTKSDLLFIMCGLVGDATVKDFVFCVNEKGCEFQNITTQDGTDYYDRHDDDFYPLSKDTSRKPTKAPIVKPTHKPISESKPTHKPFTDDDSLYNYPSRKPTTNDDDFIKPVNVPTLTPSIVTKPKSPIVVPTLQPTTSDNNNSSKNSENNQNGGIDNMNIEDEKMTLFVIIGIALTISTCLLMGLFIYRKRRTARFQIATPTYNPMGTLSGRNNNNNGVDMSPLYENSNDLTHGELESSSRITTSTQIQPFENTDVRNNNGNGQNTTAGRSIFSMLSKQMGGSRRYKTRSDQDPLVSASEQTIHFQRLNNEEEEYDIEEDEDADNIGIRGRGGNNNNRNNNRNKINGKNEDIIDMRV